ncbi:hypothetical protein PanWU01x14_092700 [Parasponia andersonii]|uniref:Uncharacterized protein n=1 Tax=Parasponia andersonii TaxID=3476 RepID=A0A2P5D6M3_PARAD|nr:hypothetical protein PanWU01x14_092700 [Parasponia andersonii]
MNPANPCLVHRVRDKGTGGSTVSETRKTCRFKDVPQCPKLGPTLPSHHMPSSSATWGSPN